MDIQAYISSGILDAYVLGAATPEEIAEVEANMAQYPEIAAEVESLQATMEGFASLHAIPPPADVRGKILDEIRGNSAPAPEPTPSTGSSAAPTRRWQMVAIAASVLLVASVIYNVVQMGQMGTMQTDLDSASAQNSTLVAQSDSCRTSWQELNRKLDDRKKAVRFAALPATAPGTDYQLGVHVNMDSRNMYLGATNLPPAPAGKHYQYWTLDDQLKPTDMGDFVPNDPDQMFEPIGVMADDAVYAAVTLEEGPHKATPDLDQLMVLGAI